MLGPMRPQPTKIWRRKFVKVLVVGDSGLGKTTLISALLSKPGEQLQVRAQQLNSTAQLVFADWWAESTVPYCPEHAAVAKHTTAVPGRCQGSSAKSQQRWQAYLGAFL